MAEMLTRGDGTQSSAHPEIVTAMVKRLAGADQRHGLRTQRIGYCM